jgi:hypothetical protein
MWKMKSKVNTADEPFQGGECMIECLTTALISQNYAVDRAATEGTNYENQWGNVCTCPNGNFLS